jgi:2-oxoglutarate dehydrogenase E2 component (dihydrolipoamide succinyltransferase)
MSFAVKVPSPGESITEVEIAQWLKSDGEFVEKDAELCEIESEKVTLTVYAEVSGTLNIKVPEGETIAVDSIIAEISENGAEAPDRESATAASAAATVAKEAAPENQPDAAAPEGDPLPIIVPTPGESITEVEIAEWHKVSGDAVQKDDPLCDIESEKVTLTIYAETSGHLTIETEAGETVTVGDSIGFITPGSVADANPSSEKTLVIAPKTPDLSTETKAAAQPAKASEPAATAKLSPSTTAQLDPDRKQRRERMSQLRRKLSERLVAVKNETAMLTTFNEVDMARIKAIRSQYKDSFKKAFDVNLGFMSFFTRAVTIALNDYPAVNGQIDGDELLYHDYADVGIAVSTPKGLMVPILRNAEKMTFAEIEKDIIRLATKARDGKLTIDEMTGGTFTITNGGIFGSMLSTPIINPPQCAILGMHNIVDRPVVVDGKVEIRPIMFIALSYDHRLIDGRESVGFLVRVKELLEAPEKMLLGLPPVQK